LAVRANGQPRRQEAQVEVLRLGHRAEFSRKLPEDVVEATVDHLGLSAPVSSREMSRSVVRISSTASSEASTFSASARSSGLRVRSASAVA
jgi:hypothetical protein